MNKTYRVGCVIFEDFETLDMMGPIELFGMYPETFEIVMVAEGNAPIASAQGPRTMVDRPFSDSGHFDILLVPGGQGTRRELDNPVLLDWLGAQSGQADYVTSVCTGSVLLARAGLLDGRRATTNKRAFEWVAAQRSEVQWVAQARWIEDGKFLTSSGVSAGMDMTLALIGKILGPQAAEDAALWAEYTWHRDADHDPFAEAAGLI